VDYHLVAVFLLVDSAAVRLFYHIKINIEWFYRFLGFGGGLPFGGGPVGGFSGGKTFPSHKN
jgi:hypothetical protein